MKRQEENRGPAVDMQGNQEPVPDMTCEQAVDYIYASWQKADPDRQWDVPDSRKRHPELTASWLSKPVSVPTALVTGSKGKGSTARMLAALLEKQGPCGLLTSPHILDFRERIRLGGSMIGCRDFSRLVGEAKACLDTVAVPSGQFISPIGSQAMTARLYFEENHAAFQVFECGKGVQFDDVGSIPHETALVTPVFKEHLRELGGSLEAIARDKAHILQPGTRTLVMARQEQAVRKIFRDRAQSLGVRVLEYGRDFRASNLQRTEDGIRFDVHTPDNEYRDVLLPTLAAFQAENCALALAASEVMTGKPSDPALLKSLDFAGRQEVLRRSPLWLLDACINRESACQLADSLRALNVKDALLVLAVPDDKDPAGTARILAPFAGEIRICPVTSGHYRITEDQCRVLWNLGVPVNWCPSMDAALADRLCETVCDRGPARQNYPVILAGTTAFVSDVYRWMQKQRKPADSLNGQGFPAGSR